MTHLHTLPARVYWEDTDASGLVYHASYLRFMERGRTELLRDLGVHQRALLEGASDNGIYFVVRAMDVGFIKPAVLDDLLTVTTDVKEIGGASLTLLQRVLRDRVTLIEATVRVVCVENGHARRLPAEVRQKFEAALALHTKA